MKVTIKIISNETSCTFSNTFSKKELRMFEEEILGVLAGEEDALLIVTEDGRTYIPSDMLKLSIIQIKIEK